MRYTVSHSCVDCKNPAVRRASCERRVDAAPETQGSDGRPIQRRCSGSSPEARLWLFKANGRRLETLDTPFSLVFSDPRHI